MPYDIKVQSNDLPKFSSRSFFFLNSYDLFCAAVAANTTNMSSVEYSVISSCQYTFRCLNLTIYFLRFFFIY